MFSLDTSTYLLGTSTYSLDTSTYLIYTSTCSIDTSTHILDTNIIIFLQNFTIDTST